jgi:RNA polymerase sigma-70 factor, ECF subfamily
MAPNIGHSTQGRKCREKHQCEDVRELFLEANRWLSEGSELDSAVTVHYNAWAVAPSDTRELEQERFASEIMAHLDHLYRSAFFLVRNKDEAQDCVQETCARALTARALFTPGTNLKAWLTCILYNFFFDAYGRNKRTVAADDVLDTAEHKKDFWDTLSSDNPGPEKRVLQLELAGKISEALKKIPDEFRAPVVLVDMGNSTYQEAAEILACPIGTIRSRLSRGRRLLQKHLSDYLDKNVSER